MSAVPIASGASGPAPGPITVHPIVSTRKKAPINSARYFCINNLLRLSLLLKRRDGFGYTLSVCRVSLRAVADVTILHHLRGSSNGTSGVLEQALLLIRLLHAEEIAWLRVVVMVILAEVELRGITVDGQWRLREVRLLLPFTVAVRLIAGSSRAVAIDSHGPVAVVAVERALRRIDRDEAVIDPESIPLCISIREQPALEHLVRREADPGNDVRRREGSLLDVRKEVLCVPIQFHLTHLNQRVVRVRPHLGQVERVDVIGVRILFVHDLDVELPPWELTLFDALVQVSLVALTITRDDLSRISVRQVLNALLRFEGELHPETLVLGVDEAVGVAPETMHVAERPGNATVGHDNGDLVQRLRKVRPEIPVAVRAPHARPRITFDRVVEIRELERVTKKEYGSIVSHQIPVALVGVELQRESADVSLGISSSSLTGNG